MEESYRLTKEISQRKRAGPLKSVLQSGAYFKFLETNTKCINGFIS